MEEEIKVRFEELDKRIANNAERFGDIKWYFGGVTSLFAIGFSVLVLVLSWNLNSEKIALREFQKDIRVDLGKIDIPANLILLGSNGKPLNNQDIKIEVLKNNDSTIDLRFYYGIKNEGNALSGPLYFKIYCSDPIKFKHNSIDEPSFKYETYVHPNKSEPNEVPGGNYIIQYYLSLNIANKDVPPTGKYPILMKLYYGKGKCVSANINIVLVR